MGSGGHSSNSVRSSPTADPTRSADQARPGYGSHPQIGFNEVEIMPRLNVDHVLPTIHRNYHGQTRFRRTRDHPHPAPIRPSPDQIRNPARSGKRSAGCEQCGAATALKHVRAASGRTRLHRREPLGITARKTLPDALGCRRVGPGRVHQYASQSSSPWSTRDYAASKECRDAVFSFSFLRNVFDRVQIGVSRTRCSDRVVLLIARRTSTSSAGHCSAGSIRSLRGTPHMSATAQPKPSTTW